MIKRAGGCEDADGNAVREYIEEVGEWFDVEADELIEAVTDDIDIEESLKLFNKVLPDNLKTAIAYAVNNVLAEADDESAQELVNYASKWTD